VQEFEADLMKLQLTVDSSDRQLGAIFGLAFDDASGLEEAFKVGKNTTILRERFW